MKYFIKLAASTAISFSSLQIAPACAQGQQTPPGDGVARAEDNFSDIVVTARKRDETLMSVPVAVTAVGAAEISRRGVNSVDGIARLVPQLLVGPQSGSVQGGNLAIRGVAGPDALIFADQAVSFNIDGVQVAKSSVRRMSSSDVAQIEVLKGPQALFYGKNSPAGVISIRTADPTPNFEAKISAGYEFEAREVRTEGYVSAPITDTLGVRLSGYYSNMKGYFVDQTPAGSLYKLSHDRHPDGIDYSLRGTLQWRPNDRLDVKLKLNAARIDNDGPGSDVQFISCPKGVRQTGSVAQCTPGNYNVHTSYGTVLATALPAGFNNQFRTDGEPFAKQEQFLGSLSIGYDLSETLRVTSTTGLYNAKYNACGNLESDYSLFVPSCYQYKNREFSQELRVATDTGGIANFVVGGFYGRSSTTGGSIGLRFLAATPTTLLTFLNYLMRQEGESYSAYGQAIIKPVETVEINVGGRYSHEEKRLPQILNSTVNLALPAATFVPATSRKSWNDFSPEVTLSYRPSGQLTIYASYKQGFLSGGFNTPSGFPAGTELSYDQQSIEGFEGGIKAMLDGNNLALTLAAYDYKITGLQVSSFVNTINVTTNAARSSVTGGEAELSYRTPVPGLTVHAAAAFNHGRYDSFKVAPCYTGQTPTLGCNKNALGINSQDLSGTELVRAPRWNISGGANYETPVGSSLKLGLSANWSYSSSYLTDVASDPAGRVSDYTLLDASLRLGASDDSWELALIGRNLGNTHYWVASPNAPFTGASATTGTAGGILGDRFASIARGREFMLRASVKFGGR